MNNKFFNDIFRRYPVLENVREPIYNSFIHMVKTFEGGGKLLVCGNGGSAADADHIVGELLKGFISKRKLTRKQLEPFKNNFPGEESFFYDNLQGGIPAISLTSNGSINTAIANDTNPEFIFAQQVYALGKEGDTFLGISTSGNSKNVVHAAKVAKALNMKTIALTGKGGGLLREHCDYTINVGANLVHEVQELHLPVYHGLCAALEDYFFEECAGDLGSMKISSGPLEKYGKQKNKLGDVELIVFDFDGVFTNNKVIVNQEGVESVVCDRSDGLLLKEITKLRIPMFILSTETNKVVKARASKLNIECKSGCNDKESFLKSFCAEKNIDLENVVYLGNDVNDLKAMESVGFSIAPQDANPEIKSMASFVLKSKGGDGAIREFCELILKNNKHWS
ncbi:SIS domain-containing protein [Bacteriovoracales bacterium]|nr:SIS domain-containing protein [Bacteriovoracales bacterium]